MLRSQWATTQLKTGDLIKTGTGLDLKVVSLVKTFRTEEVYNFTVADLHTYLVGKNQAVVHNSCGKNGQKLRKHLRENGAEKVEKLRAEVKRLENIPNKSTADKDAFDKAKRALDHAILKNRKSENHSQRDKR